MVTVPTYQPSVRIRPDKQAKLTVQASPDAMGAAVGRGLQSVAAGLGDAADAFARAQALQDETVSRDTRNAYMRDVDDLKYNAETGYLAKTGKAAIDGETGYQQKLATLKNHYAAKLTPSQRSAFEKSADAIEIDARRQGIAHRAEATKAYTIEAATAGADLFKDQAVRAYDNPQQSEKYLAAGEAEIVGLGTKLGWSPEKMREERSNFISDGRRLTALQIAETDPIAAAEYAERHRDQITGVDGMNLMRDLLPLLGKAVTSDAVKVNASKPGAFRFAASGLPSEAYSLLGVIAGTESPGYDVLNGGERFADFSNHPGRKGRGGESTAAGRYQFIAATWRRMAASLGLPDFSPASQDKAAWALAQQDYRSRTGRDLGADLKAGEYGKVRAGLSATWEGIHKISDEEFGKRMASASGVKPVIGGVSSAGGVGAPAGSDADRYSERVASLLAGMPSNYAQRLRDVAADGLKSAIASEAAAIKARQTEISDDYRLRIATDDPSLSKQEILDDAVIDNGDKAALINSLNERQAVTGPAKALLAELTGGSSVSINGYDGDQRKIADAAYKMAMEAVPAESRVGAQRAFVASTGFIPTQLMAAMRHGAGLQTAAQLGQALGVIDGLERAAPQSFRSSEGGRDIQPKLDLFRHYVNDLGLSPSEAAGRILEAESSENKKARSVLEPDARAFVKDLTVADVTDAFDTAWTWEPGAGAAPVVSNALLAEYRSVAEEKFFSTGGNAGAAKALALAELKRTWGVSRISGEAQMTRLPPENVYPAIAGSQDYLRDDALSTAKNYVAEAFPGREVANVFTLADHETVADVQAGRPPRYRLFYTYSQDGYELADEVVGSWGIDTATLKQIQGKAKSSFISESNKAVAAGQRRSDENAAAERALSETVGPDWMKAKSAEAARERARMQGEPRPEQPKSTVPPPNLETSFGSAL